MLKKHFIFSLLSFAYSIVLAHGIVPHHHHHDHRNVSCHHADDCSTEGEQRGLSHIFSFFPHGENDRSVFIAHADGSNSFRKENVPVAFATLSENILTLPDVSVLREYTHEEFTTEQKSSLFVRSLRAPPLPKA